MANAELTCGAERSDVETMVKAEGVTGEAIRINLRVDLQEYVTC